MDSLSCFPVTRMCFQWNWGFHHKACIFVIRVFNSVVLPFLASHPLFFRKREQQVSQEGDICEKEKTQYYNGEFLHRIQSSNQKKKIPAKSTICLQRGSYSDREKSWAHVVHLDFGILWHMQQESKIGNQKCLVFLSQWFLLTWLFPYLWGWKTLLSCTLYLWMPLERNGTFRVMEATTGLEQLPSAEMPENSRTRQGKVKDQEVEKTDRSLFSGPGLVYICYLWQRF